MVRHENQPNGEPDPTIVRDAGPHDVVLSWSGGKDSAMALLALQQDVGVRLAYLLTVVTEDYQRITTHGVRRELLQQQSSALGLGLLEVMIPATCTHDDYAALMEQALTSPPLQGIRTHAFADLYLADVRAYREENLAALDKTALFPVWGRDTRRFAEDFIELGFKAKVVSLDPTVMEPDLAGHDFDNRFLAALPPTVDPCGENGEFHTFVYDGPVFRQPVPITVGQTLERDGFVYTDLVPTDPRTPPLHQR